MSDSWPDFLRDSAVTKVVKLPLVSANTTYSVPAGYQLASMVVENTTANAITGGMRVGTTDTGVDVVVAQAVGASVTATVPDASILKQVFSMSAPTTIYLQAVTLWNSAIVNIYLILHKLI